VARNLNEAWGWIERLVARVSRLESGAMLEKSSITNGRMRFIGGLLRVDSGGRVEIDGTLSGIGRFLWGGAVELTATLLVTAEAKFQGATTIQNTLDVTAETRMRGATTIENTLDVSAETTLRGATAIQNTLDVEATTRLRGATTLEKDLNVKTGGRVIVEGEQSITLSSVGGTATLRFSDGPRLWSNGAAARMDSGPGTGIVLASSTAAILRSPDTSKAVAVSDDGTRITGDLISNLPLKAGATVNVHVDPNGKFWRTA
jgi:hypothetical protein